VITDQCNICENYTGALTCLAFPKGIPEDILQGDFDHSEKHPKQDNDIVFEEVS